MIRAPVDGVVLARRVEPGQTVVASFNTVTLFVIAEDLSAMQLRVSIDEADVGQVKRGQKATFTVSAYPSRTYPASITREQLAEAYELACFIHEDRQSKAILARFALDYAQAQNVEEVAEFSGGVLFEIILAALLVTLTGGVGLAVRGAASVVRLGNVLKRLSTALKRARIKRGGQAQGSGTGVQTVEVERPAAVSPSPINALPLAPRRPVIVENDVIDRPRTGSANKTDSTHSFNDLIFDFALGIFHFHLTLDVGVLGDFAFVQGDDHFFLIVESHAFTGYFLLWSRFFAFGHIIQSENHVLRRYRDRCSVGRVKDVV